jgi:hypothetical protein
MFFLDKFLLLTANRRQPLEMREACALLLKNVMLQRLAV